LLVISRSDMMAFFILQFNVYSTRLDSSWVVSTADLPVWCLQLAVKKAMKRQLLLLVMLQIHRTAVSNNVDESCETESSYTLYFTSPAAWANATHVYSCLYKAVVDENQQISPLIQPQTVVCPSLFWPQVRHVRSVSYDVVTKMILLHLMGDDDSRFTLVQARTCPPSTGNISNLTDEDEMTSHGPIQVTIHLRFR